MSWNRHHRAGLRGFLFGFVCLASLSIATPARAGSIVVEPGSGPAGGYLPLDLFGINPATVSPDGFFDVTFSDIIFAGQTFTSLSMAENGYAVLGGMTTEAGPNQSLPDTNAPNPVLAPFWTDLSGGELRWGILTDGVSDWVVLDWANMVMAGGATASFQIWLGVNGSEEITFTYDHLIPPTLPSNGLLTVGAEDPLGRTGMNYYYNGIGTLPRGELRVHSNGPDVPTPVPEPATMTLLGAGLVMSATIARRRSSRRQ